MSWVALVGGVYAFARTAGLIVWLPVLRMQGVPRFFGLLVAVLIAWTAAPRAAEVPPTVPLLAMGLIFELLFGILAAFAVSVAFSAVALASDLMAMQVGLGIARVLDPLHHSSEGILGIVASWLAGLAFLTMGLHLDLLLAVADSFHHVPPGAGMFQFQDLSAILAVGESSLAMGFQLAGPLLILAWMVNVFIALLARVAPRMNVFFAVGMSINNFLGVLLLSVSLSWLIDSHMAWVREIVAGVVGLLRGP